MSQLKNRIIKTTNILKLGDKMFQLKNMKTKNIKLEKQKYENYIFSLF